MHVPPAVADLGIPRLPLPDNEPVRGYAPGSDERSSLQARVDELAKETVDAVMVVDGKDVTGDEVIARHAPHRHDLHLADVHVASAQQVEAAVDASLRAAPGWGEVPFSERAAVLMRAAELIAGPYRDTINAATVLGQSKSTQQAEIDAVCELVDFLRFNCWYAQQIIAEQPPHSPTGTWNTMEWRPLDGFVLAVTPFNFTAIAGNLPTAPVLMGNTVVWKPSPKQALAAHHTMRVLQHAGLPDGVINLVHGDGALAVETALARRELAGVHFTGSEQVLRTIFSTVGEHMGDYKGFPRIVGESGGKDFVVAHPGAEVEPLVVALARGAFEYQGQKCSAVSRAYLPRSLWPAVRDGLVDVVGQMSMGDVGDLSTFLGAVIDESSYRKLSDALDQARATDGVEVLVGGGCDESTGWFVEPTVLVSDDPRSDTMVRELFGPVLTVFVYDDAADGAWDDVLELVRTGSDYALTGAVWSTDRAAVATASRVLRQSAGNFYVNDKPTGSVVGQQPFGGAGASGTNDKAGSHLNLLRWTSPRAVKETFVPPTDWRYPHQG